LKIGKLLLLIFLTLTVVAYNFQFHNIPSSMFLNAYNLEPKRLTYFHVTLPSKGIPNLGFRNVTDDISFRVVLDYVIASDAISYPIKVPEHCSSWFKDASNFPEYDITVKYYNDTYFLQVRYLPDFQRTPAEHEVLRAINITTIVAWFYFILTETPLKKWRMRK